MSDEGEIDPMSDDFSAFVFKIQANMNKAHRDRIAFMRICSGKFDASLAVQPTSAIHAIKLLYIWMPTVICLVCLGLSVLYDLDKKLPFIEEEIKAGRIGEKRKMN